MGEFSIVRVAVRPEGAFGVLRHRGIPFAVTLERTFDEAQGSQFVKIPDGDLRCHRDYYHKGGYPTYEIEVAGRSRILFHRGNIEKDSLGCVLIGLAFEDFGATTGIAGSTEGFRRFMAKAAGASEFTLTVNSKGSE